MASYVRLFKNPLAAALLSPLLVSSAAVALPPATVAMLLLNAAIKSFYTLL
ncbi:MAG TPA: hypothetical protein VFN30_04805 [Chitinophagaceae bacterium]|nr:hypothetical protein [Chitinophagaceae bacterium]